MSTDVSAGQPPTAQPEARTGAPENVTPEAAPRATGGQGSVPFSGQNKAGAWPDNGMPTFNTVDTMPRPGAFTAADIVTKPASADSLVIAPAPPPVTTDGLGARPAPPLHAQSNVRPFAAIPNAAENRTRSVVDLVAPNAPSPPPSNAEKPPAVPSAAVPQSAVPARESMTPPLVPPPAAPMPAGVVSFTASPYAPTASAPASTPEPMTGGPVGQSQPPRPAATASGNLADLIDAVFADAARQLDATGRTKR